VTRPGKPPRTVLVVGGGFSGVALTCALLRQARQPLNVTLVERRAALGCGVAYGTGHAAHMLNVPAGRMGVDPLDEGGFARHLADQGLAARAHDFVPRAWYAQYLRDALDAAARGAAPGVRWQAHVGDATACDDRGVRFVSGPALGADAVVLATGHLPPRPPTMQGGPCWTEPGLVPNPWQPGALDRVPAHARVLLLGTGLTALDVLLQLQACGHRGGVTMVSRRGLLPQPHRSLESPPPGGLVAPDALAGLGHARLLLRGVRALVHHIHGHGHDWRDAIAGLRPATPRLWQHLPERERQRFLRHLQPWWDTHRHRSAPQARATLDGLVASGQVQVRAARLKSLRPAADGGWQVTLQARGADAVDSSQVGWVINCTGPSSDARNSDDPLLSHLISHGLAVPDTLGLGLCVQPDYRLSTSRVGSGLVGLAGGLRYLGPLLKAGWWEAVAVPELRVHADKLAGLLVAELGVA
jgi:uncharacterized NAD(P)/FAD-binding protein YdhS